MQIFVWCQKVNTWAPFDYFQSCEEFWYSLKFWNFVSEKDQKLTPTLNFNFFQIFKSQCGINHRCLKLGEVRSGQVRSGPLTVSLGTFPLLDYFFKYWFWCAPFGYLYFQFSFIVIACIIAYIHPVIRPVMIRPVDTSLLKY